MQTITLNYFYKLEKCMFKNIIKNKTQINIFKLFIIIFKNLKLVKIIIIISLINFFIYYLMYI